jgi:nitrogen-specific signal transduction histidine kinase
MFERFPLGLSGGRWSNQQGQSHRTFRARSQLWVVSSERRNSAADVVKRSRALFQRHNEVRTHVDMNGLVLEVSRLMVNEMAANEIQLRTDLEEDLPFAVVDLIQIRQVLMNWTRNGIEALESQPPRKRVLDIHSLCRPAGNISIKVHDHVEAWRSPSSFRSVLLHEEELHGNGIGDLSLDNQRT